MFLIFGITVREQVLGVLQFVCETCGQLGPHRLVRHVRRFSLFFLPLFSVGSRYVDQCGWCARQLEVSREQAEKALPGVSGA